MNQAPAKVNPKFPHHMIREIYEQPDAVRRVLKDNIDNHGRNPSAAAAFYFRSDSVFLKNHNRRQRLQPPCWNGGRIHVRAYGGHRRRS